MSSTNKTANYELSQFVGTDIPSILGDYNGDMRKIDAAIGEVASSAGSSASAVSALAGRVTTVENNVQTLEGAQTVTNQRSVQNQVAITAIQGEIPDNASSENKLVTEAQLDEVSADGKAVDLRLQDVEAIIPSNASTSNKLATMSDIGGSTSNYRLLYEVPSGMTPGQTQLQAIANQLAELDITQRMKCVVVDGRATNPVVYDCVGLFNPNFSETVQGMNFTSRPMISVGNPTSTVTTSFLLFSTTLENNESYRLTVSAQSAAGSGDMYIRDNLTEYSTQPDYTGTKLYILE